MRKVLINSVIMATLLISSSAFAIETIKMQVNGLVCAFCAQGIDKKVRALPQTQDVYVNLKQKVVLVEEKEGQVISDVDLTELVKKAGYTVVKIERLAHPLVHIKEAIKAGAE
jgi:cation transport ATPase